MNPQKQFIEPDKKMLGEILVKRKKITDEQLQEALKAQRQSKKLIGEVFVDLGYLEEQDIVVALIVQCNFPYIAINKYAVADNVLQVIPKAVAQKYHAVPLDLWENILSVVIANPLDQSQLKDLEKLTGFRVATFIATRSEIDQAIKDYY